MSYIDERNAAMRVLRDMVQTTSGKKQAALKFAVKHLEGLPEHWVAVDTPQISILEQEQSCR